MIFPDLPEKISVGLAFQHMIGGIIQEYKLTRKPGSKLLVYINSPFFKIKEFFESNVSFGLDILEIYPQSDQNILNSEDKRLIEELNV